MFFFLGNNYHDNWSSWRWKFTIIFKVILKFDFFLVNYYLQKSIKSDVAPDLNAKFIFLGIFIQKKRVRMLHRYVLDGRKTSEIYICILNMFQLSKFFDFRVLELDPGWSWLDNSALKIRGMSTKTPKMKFIGGGKV